MQWQTHQITNQAPDLQDYNIFSSDKALMEGVRREQAAWHEPELIRFGAELGNKDVLQLGQLANRHAPELISDSEKQALARDRKTLLERSARLIGKSIRNVSRWLLTGRRKSE